MKSSGLKSFKSVKDSSSDDDESTLSSSDNDEPTLSSSDNDESPLAVLSAFLF